MQEKYLKNLDLVIRKIERARLAFSAHHIVTLIAVSKYASAQEINMLYECGQRAFGENKVQDLKAKSESLQSLPLQWHMIGTLQENKINALIELSPTLLHSLDSLKLALALQKRLESKGKKMRALLQLNTSFESSKSGIAPNEAKELYHKITEQCPNIAMEGIMTIGAHSNERKKIEKSFVFAKEVFDSLQNLGARTLSMGMSGDFELAILCGANMVRIGSRLFQ
ncbi:YggS family pyridoxal phosphate-dependent enzyme [Helicobacter himalayensis]|uniref:YggS family pyridoxal phosphate-dependent enzyme n=1 Tax=Helicobacter himalayensis TaxID=1591088 RepID=UPI00082D15B3|nr:YggS family pyridoxal phosphate-dependent enzyme [Helicobacter himalayensis]